MKELRIGLVLYGGVSLAIYMNGIVTELWHLLRASRARGDGTVDQLDGNACIYAELLGEVAKISGHDLRIVVDAVAGTSAGGVNGAVLAKAVVDGGDASVLNRVWTEEADISNLRAEPVERLPWYGRAAFAVFGWVPRIRKILGQVDALPGMSSDWIRDHVYSMIKADDGKSTMLKGGYFAEMIAKTFADMERSGDGEPLLPKRGTFDLFLTRTDLRGWPRHLPVSEIFHPKPLYERTHAHVMHFCRGPNGGKLDDDFGLTYAARSTASFPIAFAPITYDEIAEAYRRARKGEAFPTKEQFARNHLAEHRLFDFPAEHAWMVDGGVLDNKPFSHVTRAIERKPADHEVYRAVVYIEPDPETEISAPSGEVPKPIQVAASLYGLFRHEPIYEDLGALQARNFKVREIKAILDADRDNAKHAAEAAAQNRNPPLDLPPKATDAATWREVTNSHAARDALSGYPGYVVLKARGAAAFLAGLICRALGYPYDSRHAYFVRRLVLAWLADTNAARSPSPDSALARPRPDKDGGYELNERQTKLLAAFDVPFRLRRLRALVRAANNCYDNAAEGAPELRSKLDSFKRALADAAFALEAAAEDQRALHDIVLEALGEGVLDVAVDTAIKANDFNPTQFIKAYGDRVAAVYTALEHRFTMLGDAQNIAVTKALAEVTPPAPDAIMWEYVTFPFIDLIAYPLMATGGIGDLFEVRTMRISPNDVPELEAAREPLKCAALGAFMGFLDRSAREHDIVWGRFDGANRLVELIMNAAGVVDSDKARADQIRRTHMQRLTKSIRDAGASA